MTEKYSINIKLQEDYDQKNIQALLEQGSLLGFVYCGTSTNDNCYNAPRIDAQHAAEKILLAFQHQALEGPCVLTFLDPKSTVTLRFNKGEDTCLNFYIENFSPSCKQKNQHLDVSYYTSLFLSLCNDLIVLEVKAKTL